MLVGSKGTISRLSIDVVYEEIRQICRKQNNSSKQGYTIKNNNERSKDAIKQLKENEGIIIRQANKGGGLVIQDRGAYLAEVIRLIGDSTTYEKLSRDPLLEYKTSLKQLLDRAIENKIITEKEYQFLYKQYPHTSHFYHIPKIHKDLSDPPRRPIIVGIDSLMSNLGCYIDHFLQDLVVELPVYVRDSGHMLDILSCFAWQPQFRCLCTHQ